MALIPFPNVPYPVDGILSGIPPIPRSPNFPPTLGVVLSTVQGALWRALEIDNSWGIFDETGARLGDTTLFGISTTGTIGTIIGALGGPTISTVGMSYSKDTRIADFPVERGTFASYNKVEMPSEPMVTLAMVGSDAERTKFLSDIEAACKSTKLYSVVTPDATYIEHSIERYNYERTSQNGAYLLTMQIFLKQIRQVQATFTKIANAKNPTSVSQQSGGQVQPRTPTGNTNFSKLTPQ